MTALKACDWSGHIFSASASPRSLTKKLATSPSSTVHGGQHDTKYVTLEFLLHAAFVAVPTHDRGPDGISSEDFPS